MSDNETWVDRAVKAYKDQKQKQEAEKQEHARLLALAVSPLIGQIVRPVGDRITVSEPNSGVHLTFSFGEGTGEVVIIRKCPDCNKEFEIPIPNRAAVGKIIVDGYPPHLRCPAKEG